MNNSGALKVCRLFGIDLQLHYTFLLLVAWLGWRGYASGGIEGGILQISLVVGVFICVVLHELGHALSARRYGIPTERILLMPIGGMAQLVNIPRNPRVEMIITAWGPVVNFILAGLVYGLLQVTDKGINTVTDFFLLQILYVNLIMGGFNLLPAFPMDGGRMLRAMLSLRLSYVEATKYACWVGKLLSGLGILYGALVAESFLLSILFAFIYLAGNAEYHAVKNQ